MFGPINKYCEWNSALWRYFFPSKEENAILYIDETVLTQVAEINHIKHEEGQDWTHQFLSCTLLSGDDFESFKLSFGKIARVIGKHSFRLLGLGIV